jgi:mRNA-degrading endonuclease toxin of MazEF toxin-antitoxin module
MRRGTVAWVDLQDAHPPELGKMRPAIVVSNTEQNEVLDSVVVVPMSTRAPAIWPLRLSAPPVGKVKNSYAVCPGIRQVAKRRLVRQEGIAPQEFMDGLADALEAYLDD